MPVGPKLQKSVYYSKSSCRYLAVGGTEGANRNILFRDVFKDKVTGIVILDLVRLAVFNEYHVYADVHWPASVRAQPMRKPRKIPEREYDQAAGRWGPGMVAVKTSCHTAFFTGFLQDLKFRRNLGWVYRWNSHFREIGVTPKLGLKSAKFWAAKKNLCVLNLGLPSNFSSTPPLKL